MIPDEANYVQDDPSYQPYAAEALNIIEALKRGDGDGLDALPGSYQTMLREQMEQALAAFTANEIGQDLFDLEVRKMVSVACIGLRELAVGE